jgi:hypothetical protein
MGSLKKARTMNSNAQRVVAVVSYLMMTTTMRNNQDIAWRELQWG